ncbi:MAG: hypothetical protein JSS96_03455 [Bacteroidetes bacterium]|nr:hypothetical protein [Bacteroidota bacterium]
MQGEQSITIMIIAGCMLFLIMGIFIVIVLLIYQRRHYNYLKEKEELNAEFAQTLLQAQIEIQEQTLIYVSREIHDNLGYTAALVKMNLFTLGTTMSSVADKKINNIIELVRKLNVDLKTLSVNLGQDHVMQKGLIKAVETDIANLNDTGIFEVNFEVSDNFPEITKKKTLILYRMLQEIFNNIIKHSKATKIGINFYHDEGKNILKINDNGKGFDIEVAQNNFNGAGLVNLKNRAKFIDATIEIKSIEGQGTTVIIELFNP